MITKQLIIYSLSGQLDLCGVAYITQETVASIRTRTHTYTPDEETVSLLISECRMPVRIQNEL